MTFIEELKWRGLLHDIVPGTEDFLNNNIATGYVGFDPTAPSLGIGNLVPLMLLVHFQRYGHRPIALVGGATGRIGDPSGKSRERNLLSEEELDFNLGKMKAQLSRFLDFENEKNPAKMVNNYDWFKNFQVLDFLRDVGKHLTVNYMLSKDSVKSRLGSESGISFTEFSYQLIQGYDFYHLHKHYNCDMQFGGSDQWGNITAGTELIRRMMGHEENVFAFTCPLITKADGSKYGKSEEGNIYIDPEMTSAFDFYQFWLNLGDDDAIKLIKIFSLKSVDEIKAIIETTDQGPRYVHEQIAKEMTARIHGEDALKRVLSASKLLFGKGGIDDLKSLSQKEITEIFKGVSQGYIQMDHLKEGLNIIDFLSETGAFNSKSEAKRKVVMDKCVSINTIKVDSEGFLVDENSVINNQFILINRSKKDRHLVYVS